MVFTLCLIGNYELRITNYEWGRYRIFLEELKNQSLFPIDFKPSVFLAASFVLTELNLSNSE
jgi:hypothetical protein